MNMEIEVGYVRVRLFAPTPDWRTTTYSPPFLRIGLKGAKTRDYDLKPLYAARGKLKFNYFAQNDFFFKFSFHL